MWLLLLWLQTLAQEIEFKVDESLRVEYIMLDIVARDKQGRLITDLNPADFLVKDNRKAVEPDVFQILDYRKGNGKDEAGEVVALPPRQFILALDTESARFQEGLETFAQLKDFVKNLSEDQPYKIKIVSLERDALKAEFVDNSQAALKELDELEARFRRFNKPYKAPDRKARKDLLLFGDNSGSRVDLSQRGKVDYTSLEEAVNHLSQLEAAFIECERKYGRGSGPCIEETLATFMFEQKARSERVFAELEKMAYKFEDLEGLKVLLFVSAGFAYQMNSTPFEMANLYLDLMQRSTREGHNRLDERAKPIQMTTKGRLYMENPFRKVVHACTKNRVVFHTFFILNTNKGFKSSISKGVKDPRAFNIYKGYGFEISEGLRGLAHESGGRYFGNQPLVPALLEALDGEKFYYVLGYPAPAGRAGKFHEIKVKVKRKGVKLSYRRGYFSGDAR